MLLAFLLTSAAAALPRDFDSLPPSAFCAAVVAARGGGHVHITLPAATAYLRPLDSPALADAFARVGAEFPRASFLDDPFTVIPRRHRIWRVGDWQHLFWTRACAHPRANVVRDERDEPQALFFSPAPGRLRFTQASFARIDSFAGTGLPGSFEVAFSPGETARYLDALYRHIVLPATAGRVRLPLPSASVVLEGAPGIERVREIQPPGEVTTFRTISTRSPLFSVVRLDDRTDAILLPLPEAVDVVGEDYQARPARYLVLAIREGRDGVVEAWAAKPLTRVALEELRRDLDEERRLGPWAIARRAFPRDPRIEANAREREALQRRVDDLSRQVTDRYRALNFGSGFGLARSQHLEIRSFGPELTFSSRELAAATLASTLEAEQARLAAIDARFHAAMSVARFDTGTPRPRDYSPTTEAFTGYLRSDGRGLLAWEFYRALLLFRQAEALELSAERQRELVDSLRQAGNTRFARAQDLIDTWRGPLRYVPIAGWREAAR